MRGVVCVLRRGWRYAWWWCCAGSGTAFGGVETPSENSRERRRAEHGCTHAEAYLLQKAPTIRRSDYIPKRFHHLLTSGRGLYNRHIVCQQNKCRCYKNRNPTMSLYQITLSYAWTEAQRGRGYHLLGLVSLVHCRPGALWLGRPRVAVGAVNRCARDIHLFHN